MSITAFFKPKLKLPEPEMLHWKTMKAIKDTTERVEVDVKARVGSYVQHTVHGKVMLVSKPSPDKLEIEIKTDSTAWPSPGGIVSTRMIVDAVDCSDPQAVARARDPSVYAEASDEALAAALVGGAFAAALSACGEGPARPAARGGKAKAPVPKEPKKRGRPKGSKDSTPRTPRAAGKVAWVYEGTKAAKGRQVATIGAAVEHDGFGRAVLLEQVDLDYLQLQAGTDGNEYPVRVESVKCFVVENPAAIDADGSGAGGSGAAGSDVTPKRRKTGGRKRTALTQADAFYGLTPLSTKGDVQRAAKRKKREVAAIKKGSPLKPLRTQKNRKWPVALKEQAVKLYHRQFAANNEWSACRKELGKLPGFDGVTAANIRAWVITSAARAEAKPNEYGLLVTRAGRPPVLPAELYEEVKALVKSLAASRAIRICTSSMLPVVRSLIVHRLGADVIRPGRGGFIVGPKFLKKLASDCDLKWRKPYGDARKPPADADAQIHDMIMRLAYLMKEYSIPRGLVLNFDQTGLHFMQQRGSTYTAVEEDTKATHKSRSGKQKETKLKGLNDKRQATGTVGISFAGDVCPGQLIVEGTPANHRALPDLDGCNYAKGRGNSPGHAVGWRLVQHGLDASRGLVQRQWLGHLVQTSNHWANIRTSYAILEFIIVPWLLQKKTSMDLGADHPAILIVDCWYGWKDQDKLKTLQNLRDCTRCGSERRSSMVRCSRDALESRAYRRPRALPMAQAAVCAGGVHRLGSTSGSWRGLVAEGSHASLFYRSHLC